MSNITIKVENLSKQYRLGEVGTGTIKDDLNRWWHRVRGKEDPFLKIGESNDRTKKGDSEYVWALQDVNFEVHQGEILGIIGKNGAGKSTLLKILSKVTAPTTGAIKAKGRIASLLEVGTGFHPELSGRENIYLNGTILGMTRAEVKSKLDEIIDFAGVERYIDTPVKRYSSGMMVRLGFAVAAHLDPEILIVDEVLAVGDADFQKKAIGKMQEVSRGEGRTVLFVSHNMQAIRQLCNQLILMKNGAIQFQGSINQGINKYYEANILSNGKIDLKDEIKVFKSTDGSINFLSYLNEQKLPIDKINYGEKFNILIDYTLKNEVKKFNVAIGVTNQEGVKIFSENLLDYFPVQKKDAGDHTIQVSVDSIYFRSETYFLTIVILEDLTTIDTIENFPMPEIVNEKKDIYMEARRWGLVRIPTFWQEIK